MSRASTSILDTYAYYLNVFPEGPKSRVKAIAMRYKAHKTYMKSLDDKYLVKVAALDLIINALK